MKKKPLDKNEVEKQSKIVKNIILSTLNTYIYFYRFLASALGVWEWQKKNIWSRGECSVGKELAMKEQGLALSKKPRVVYILSSQYWAARKSRSLQFC